MANTFDALFSLRLTVEEAPGEPEANENWKKFKMHLDTQPGKVVSGRFKAGLWLRRFAAVAAMLILVAAFFIFNHLKDQTGPGKNTNIVSTKKGSKSNVILPDGTQVWLNADSRISYNEDFNTNREVTLSGEAFFDVVHNKYPFIVHTKVMNIKVIGTAFNVRAYDSEANTQTTLLRGAVEVSLIKKNSEKITLKPNEKLVVQNDYEKNEKITTNEVLVPKISLLPVKKTVSDTLSNEVLWVQNKLVFDQARLADIATVLERWYDVKVIINDSSLANRSLSGIYENETIEEVMESFKLAAGFNYTVRSNVIEIFE